MKNLVMLLVAAAVFAPAFASASTFTSKASVGVAHEQNAIMKKKKKKKGSKGEPSQPAGEPTK
jgi:hypothetical protein